LTVESENRELMTHDETNSVEHNINEHKNKDFIVSSPLIFFPKKKCKKVFKK